jgi:PAS domain S-box-containing protein
MLFASQSVGFAAGDADKLAAAIRQLAAPKRGRNWLSGQRMDQSEIGRHAERVQDPSAREDFIAVGDAAGGRAAEHRLELALSGADLALADWHIPSDTLVLGAGWAKLVGYRPDELPASASTLAWLMAPEDLAAARNVLVRHLKGETALLEGEVRMRHRDGRWIWVLARGMAVERADDGRAVRVTGTAMDVTERRRVAAELDRHRHHLEELAGERTRALEAMHRRLKETEFAMDQVGIATYWVDACSGRFLNVNAAACQMLGYSREELLAIGVPDINPEFQGRDFGAASEGLRRQGQFRVESVNVARDGRRVPVEVTGYFQPASDGEPDRFIAFVTDISERERAKLKLQEAKEAAEAASRAKSRFLANISHEIRTPMNAILGMAHLIRQDGITGGQAARLDTIDAAAQHLLKVLNDVLDLSKIEADRLQLEQDSVHLTELLRSVAGMIAPEAGAKRLAVQVDPASPALWVRGDAMRLRQALLNYASNAVKFTARGTIRLAARVVDERRDGRLVRFEVRDTGPGVESGQLERLFQPFTQADASTTRRFGGTGLGLAITLRLAQLMGGTAGADSLPGEGSTFWFTALLGRCEAAAAACSDAAVAAADLAKLRHAGARVLLAEDNEVNREVALMMLAQADLQVETAASGAEALELAGRKRFDLILMDVQMPGMDGLEATREIRKLPGAAAIPILALTASAFEQDRRDCIDAGMDDFITKPVHLENLYAVLLKWLSGPGHQAAT